MNRSNGRAPDALRPIRLQRGYLKFAMGSCLFELGDTRVLCAANVIEGVGAWRRGSGSGWVTAEYSMLPPATPQRGRREVNSGRPTGRTHEIQRLIGRSLRTVVDMRGLGGEHTLTIDCDVLQADGGTRTASITGAWIAARDALMMWIEAGRIKTSPLIDHVAAVSVGVVDGVAMLDIDYAEDSHAEIDMNIVMDGSGRFIELQGTGERTPFDKAKLDGLIDLAAGGIGELVAVQRLIIEEDIRAYGF